MDATTALTTVEPRHLAVPSKRRRAETLAPGARIGAWRIEGELGRGGMATVYAVVHTKFGKRAALKLAHRDLVTEKLPAEAFLREARIVNLVDHPCVPDVFATGTFDGRPYIVMDRLAGPTLADLARGTPITRREALGVLAELCDVLATAHAAGLVHRDLKLANVIVLDSPCPAGRRVKLIDWGVAYVTSEPDPLTGMIAGTLTYVAPEQIRGDGVTAATDVYSLAVLAYELLLGDPPFAAADDLELLRLHLNQAPPSPHATWPTCPAALAELLVAMLAKMPADRPALADVAAGIAAARAELVATSATPPPLPAVVLAPAAAAPPSTQRATSLLPRLARRWLGPAVAVGALAAALVGLVT